MIREHSVRVHTAGLNTDKEGVQILVDKLEIQGWGIPVVRNNQTGVLTYRVEGLTKDIGKEIAMLKDEFPGLNFYW